MRRSRIGRGGRPARLVGLALALALTATACSSGDSSDDSSTGSVDADSAASTETEDGGGEASGTFRMAVPTVVSNIDPAVYEGTPSTELEMAWAGTLYEFADPDGVSDDMLGMTGLESVEPFLVESDEVEDDGSLVVTLKEAVSPYGNTLTAEDVAWTIDRVYGSGDFVGQFVLSVARVDAEDPVEVIDDRTFRLNVTEPNPFVRGVLTLWNLSPLDSTEVQAHATEDDPWASEWLKENTATYGPYQVTSFAPGESITVAANPNWIGDAPGFSDVVMRQVPDASSRLQLLNRGEVEYAAGLQPEQFASLEGSDSVATRTRVGNTMVMLELNHEFEPFSDVRVRQAIAHAIDREAIVEGPMQGYAGVLGNQIPSGLEQPEAPEPYTYDPEEARRLLEEAGYADGLEFPLAINLTRPGPYAEQIAVLLESQLEAVGMSVDIETVAASSEFEDRKTNGQLTAWLGANTPIIPEAWYFMQLEHHSTDAFQNWKGYASSELDEMLAELRDIPLGDERDAAIAEIHDFLMGDVPYVPIFDSRILVAVSDAVDVESVRQYSPFGPVVHAIEPA